MICCPFVDLDLKIYMMIEVTNPNGQISATNNDEETIPAGSKAQPSYIYIHVDVHVFRYYWHQVGVRSKG